MLRRIALLTALVGAAGMSAVGVSAPAGATPVTSSNITSPVDGFRYLRTDAHPGTSVLVQGTSNGTTGSVDIRCYYGPGLWGDGGTAAVGPDGKFGAQVSTNSFYGTCLLRAVPDGWPPFSSLASFTGPRVTSEEMISRRVGTGPNANRVFDYYVSYVGAHAFNDFHSAFSSGLDNSRLQYADGSSSNPLWYPSGRFWNSEPGSDRSFLQVDGRNAFGPYSAAFLFNTVTDHAYDNPGLPQVTYSAKRDVATGTTTIHETDPIVVCPNEAPFPPTPTSCPRFDGAGVRLDRTIITTDGGRQTLITDVWRSTDGKPHTVSPHYQQQVEGLDSSTGTASQVQVGVKLPWLSKTYKAFAGDTVLPGPSKLPATIYVHDNNLAADGNKDFLRGAVTFDFATSSVHRIDNGNFTLRGKLLKVPAGGTRLVRQAYVIGTTQSTVDAKAAANERRINPWRPDALVRPESTHTWTGNNVYNATGNRQTAGAHARRGASTSFYLGVQNGGTQPDSLKLRGPGGASGFSAHYYAGKTDVTVAVRHGTYAVKNLEPGAVRTIRLVVTVKAGATIGAVRSWRVASTSARDGTRTDVVVARVRVARH